MNVSNQQARSIGRLLLEKAALKEVCACRYYELADDLEITSSVELANIIKGNYNCALCGRKGA